MGNHECAGTKEPVRSSAGGDDYASFPGRAVRRIAFLSPQMYLPVDLLLVNLAVRAAATNHSRGEME